MSSAEYSCKLLKPIFAYRQTVWTQIRLLLEEQSDLGPHCLQKWLLNHKQMTKQMAIVVIGALRVKRLRMLVPFQLSWQQGYKGVTEMYNTWTNKKGDKIMVPYWS